MNDHLRCAKNNDSSKRNRKLLTFKPFANRCDILIQVKWASWCSCGENCIMIYYWNKDCGINLTDWRCNFWDTALQMESCKKSEKVESGISFVDVWGYYSACACFEKLKSRFKLIRFTITSYISLVLIEKRVFNLLRDIQKLLLQPVCTSLIGALLNGLHCNHFPYVK